MTMTIQMMMLTPILSLPSWKTKTAAKMTKMRMMVMMNFPLLMRRLLVFSKMMVMLGMMMMKRTTMMTMTRMTPIMMLIWMVTTVSDYSLFFSTGP